MAYKVFTNGSVLNASEINDNLMNQSVMVFSNSTARSAAITSPVEGMLTYLEDVDRYEHWNSSSWVSPFGLTKVASQTFTGVSSVSFNNVFSSSYKDYLFLFSGVHTTGEAGCLWRLRSAGTDNSSANYFFGSLDITNSGGPTRSYSGSATNGYVANIRNLRTSFSFTISDPSVAVFKTALSQSTAVGTAANVFMNAWSSGNVASAFDGITFLLTGGAFTGTITAYGYRS